MLQYALTKDTQSLAYIDEVPNGKRCNCYCPACGDDLTAHNGGRGDQAHHFKHTTKAELRSCLMTQLHLWGQHYFNNAETFTVPAPVITHQSRTIDNDYFLTIKPTASTLEKKFGPYFADVHLETETEDLVIEIKVTHACEPEKINYYQEQQIPTVEIDLSKFSNTPIGEVAEHFEEHAMEVDWIYPYGKEEAIEQYLILLTIERLSAINKARSNAEKVLRNLQRKRPIKLPALMSHHRPLSKSYTGKASVPLVLQGPVETTFDNVEFISTDDYLLYRCSIGQRTIHILAYFEFDFEFEPALLDITEASIVVLPPNATTPYWYRHARFAELKQNAVIEWAARAAAEGEISSVLEDAEHSFKGSDYFFKQDYGRWRNLITKNKLFQPTRDQKNPPIPACLKHISKDQDLWMFNAWPVYVATEFMAILDARPEKEFSHEVLFNLLCQQFPLDPSYSHVIKLIRDNDFGQSLNELDSRSIMYKLLKAPLEQQWLRQMDNGWVKQRQDVSMLDYLYKYNAPRY